MAEYIEREAVLEILNGLYNHHLTMGNYAADGATQDCIEAVIEAPAADVVEVVRCKDCEFRYTKECPQFILPLDDNGFCSYGERKE